MAKIILAADHAGFDLKEKLKKFLAKDYEMMDLSPVKKDGDDYPSIAFKAGKEAAATNTPGIFICGSGQGMCISANKVKGIRASLAYDLESAVMSKKHNDSNVLCLPGRRIEEKEAIRIIRAWLSTEFEGGRHKRRIDKISKYEN